MPLDFGIEIECLVPGTITQRSIVGGGGYNPSVGDGLAQCFIEAGIRCRWAGYTHQQIDNWKIVYDGSISPPVGYVGLEVVSPPMNESRMDEIHTVCRVLREQHARTNRTCGLHVHIGARGMSIAAMRKLAFLYIENEDVVDSLLPPSRRGSNNTFCQSLKSHANLNALNQARDAAAIARALRGSPYDFDEHRYVKLNFRSFLRHGTVEFRHHSGTIDPEKIIRWIHFCSKLVDVAINTADQPNIVERVAGTLTPPRGAARRTLFEMAMRPEGVTAQELQNALGRQTRTPVPSALKRLGFGCRQEGNRGGDKIYKIIVPMVENSEPATLAALLSKIAATDEEAAFWRNRHALLLGAVRNSVPGDNGQAEVA